MARETTIKFFRGLFADLPTLLDGEPGWTLDTHQFFIGHGGVNYEITDTTAYLPLASVSAFGLTLIDDASAAAARTTLGLAIGTDVQAQDATLAAFAALTIAANSLTIGTGADAFSQTTFAANTFPARASTGDLVAKAITDFALTILDDTDAAAVRTTIGAGTSSTPGPLGYIILEHQETSGTGGGSSTSGSWETRTINTEVTDTNSDCTLSANQFTLAAGTYLFIVHAPAYDSSFHQLRLVADPDGTPVYYYGKSEFNVTNCQSDSRLVKRLVLGSSTEFEIQSQVNSSEATIGYGVDSGFTDTTEVYTQVLIIRIV